MTLATLAASANPWQWHPHPDVWMLIMLLGGAYVYSLRRLASGHAPPGAPAATRKQVTMFFCGLAALWVGADWPIHDLAEGYLFSAHMTQHTLFSLVAPPLLLLGVPRWLAERVVRPAAIGAAVRRMARPLPALILFNAVIVITHWAPVVNLALRSEPAHLSLHVVLFTSAALMWMPVVSPLADPGRLEPPAQMLYLFVQSIVPTVPASFFTFSRGVIYDGYASSPQIWGLSHTEDQQIAGVVMKIGGGLILWGVIALVFFRWQAAEESEERRAGSRRREDEARRGDRVNSGKNGHKPTPILGVR